MDLKRHFDLGWLVRQATFDVASVSCLEDCDLIRLLADMERARECIEDGISFADAGLIRSTKAKVGAEPAWSRRTIAECESSSSRICADRFEPPRARQILDEAPF